MVCLPKKYKNGTALAILLYKYVLPGADMSIKDILLHLDDSPSCERRIDCALNLAHAHGATVTGLAIATYEYYQPHYLHAEEKRAFAGALLEAKAHAAGVESCNRTIESNIVGVGTRELLIRAAHCSDLVIMGQESRRIARDAAVVEHLIAGGGRPVLVVPAAGTSILVGTRVLVAWKNGREAARALHDALPILQSAEEVMLLAVATGDESHQDQWEEVQAHLQSHGIKARTELQPVTSAPLADTLLNYACEGGYNLLVMGAYQPGSRRGSPLGTVAGQILREMTIPVLMSH
jgi:nucleotide-binding universal stress UspA family protein